MPELKTQGVDMDLLWQTRLDGLSLQAGATYTDAKYGDDALPDTALALLPGSTASFAPKWALTGGVTYQWDFNASLMGRSEEHTSELQSLMRISYAVFCLKKNKKQ